MPPSAPIPHDVALRVRHFVDGRSVAASGSRVYELPPCAVDQGRRGVPIASPAEAGELVARCGEGLARWMALGVQRRQKVLRTVSAALRDRTLDLAEAYADDIGVPTVDTVIAIKKVIDTMLAVVDESPAPPLRPGIYLYWPSNQHTGSGFVPLLWPLLLGGSTLVIHPQLALPRVGQAYVHALSEAGLPDGVINLIYGDFDTTLALLADPAIAGVLGVGPPEHAAALAASADAFGKRRLTRVLAGPIGAARSGRTS